MRRFILTLCLASTAMAQQAVNETRGVTTRESKTSSAEAKPPKPLFPVESTILSADYHVKPGAANSATGTAAFEVQSFHDGPQAVSLMGDSAIVESFEPKDATLITKDGYYAIAVEGQKRAEVTLTFSTSTTKRDDGTATEIKICPAVSSTLELEDIPEGRTADVEGAVPSGNSKLQWHLPRMSTLKIALREPARPLPPPINMPAVIHEAASDMRVVTDGSFLNRMIWRIRHQAPLVWTVALPEDCPLKKPPAHLPGTEIAT